MRTPSVAGVIATASAVLIAACPALTEEAVEQPDLLTLAQGAVLLSSPADPNKALALTDGDPASAWSIGTKRNPPPYAFIFELMAPAQLSAVGVEGAGSRPGGVVGGSAGTVEVAASSEGPEAGYEVIAEVSAAEEGLTMVAVETEAPVRWLRFTVMSAQTDTSWIYFSEAVAHGAMKAPEDPERFNGVFQTGRNTTLELKQDGLSLSGCFTENSGRSAGVLNGSVQGGVALLEWNTDKGVSGTAILTRDSAGGLSGVRYRHKSRSAWGGPPASPDTITPCSDVKAPSNPILEALQKNGVAKIYGILFNHDSDVPRSISNPALRQLLDALETAPTLDVVIEGHTDSDGADAYNLDLSDRRAASVLGWLVKRGVASERLGSLGKGETMPVASNKTADGKALNRRVEVRLR